MKRLLLALVGMIGLVGAACLLLLTDRGGIEIFMACLFCVLAVIFLVMAWRGKREEIDKAVELVVDRALDNIM